MIPDTNNIVSFAGSTITNLIGGEGNLLFIGILIFITIVFVLLLAWARASTTVMIGAVLAVMLSFVEPAFGFLFWIAILVAIVELINGLRKQFTSQ
jgi:hypothetical protein